MGPTWLRMTTDAKREGLYAATMATTDELPKPPLTEHSIEIVRLWLCGDKPGDGLRGLRVMLRAGVFSDPMNPRGGSIGWGMALADLAREVAEGLAAATDVDEGIALANIMHTFMAELGTSGEKKQ